MFNRVSQILIVAILGLCGWSWFQFQTIRSLQAENRTQAQTIESQQQVNQQLAWHLESERQAVILAQKNAKSLQKKVETTQNEIKAILAKEQCANTALPDGVIDSIKRLHQQNNHKH